jgi:chromosome segregation ATPase
MEDVEIKKEYTERLNQDVQTLEIRKSNLESQIHSLQVRLTSERKLIEQEKKVKFAEEEERIKRLDNKLYEREQCVELKEIHLKEREKFIVAKELDYAEYRDNLKVFDSDKRLFQEYKEKHNKEVKEAKVILAEAREKEKELKVERDGLEGLRIQLERREQDIDIQLGELERKNKEFEIYKNSEIERLTKREVANV